jgi:AraC family transcriptional regulator, positive regulator of tynA and feaB
MVDSAAAGQSEGTSSASRATGNVEIWSTDGIQVHERFSYWREAVRAMTGGLFPVSAEAQSGGFSARAAIRSSGPLRFALVQSATACKVVRSRRDIANAASDHYSIYLQLSGETISLRGEEAITLCAGDFGFCDGRKPFRAEYGGSCAIAMVPRAMIEMRAPWLRGRPHRKLASNARFANHLKLHMTELTTDVTPLSDSETSLLTDSLCNLVALAAADGIPSRQLQPELQVEALLAFCRQNLHDASLSPQQAAERIGISVRTLHSRFQQIGQTFGRWVLENRLEGCSAALRDPNQLVLNISEIAYRWGFSDLSYFNRAFRDRFDMTPSEWRSGPKAS